MLASLLFPLVLVTTPALPGGTHAPGERGSYNGRPVLWQPWPGFQTRFCASGAFETLGGGAAGPGKTDCLIALAAGDAQHPSAKVLVLRTVYKEMQDIRDRMDVLYPQIGATWEATDGRWRFPSGGFVALGHGASMAEIGPFLGPEYTSINWDELSLLKEETIWQYALSRIRSTDPTVRLCARGTANPVGPGKPWLTERFIAKCGGEKGGKVYRDPATGRTRTYIPGKATDNPSLPADYWLGLADFPPSVVAAMRDGLWTSPLGLFYPELADERERLFITQEQLPSLLDWHEHWSALDWGFAPHPLAFGQFTRIGQTVYWRDTLYLHRYQDEEQAATIKGWADPRCLRTCYAGHDAFAVRKAHSAAIETVADVYARYGILLERAAIDRSAGAKVVRRFIAKPKPGPMPKDALTLRIVDTPGNRRAITELAALIPEETDPQVPMKRNANEAGMNGDDGADMCRYGLATPTFEPIQPPVMLVRGNVETGVDREFEEIMNPSGFRLTEQGQYDKRVYEHRGQGPEGDFPE